MNEFITVLVTASSQSEAEKIGQDLVGSCLVACANLVPGILSLFRWKGKVQREQEVLLVMKSRAELFSKIEQRVRELHSYDVPEILALPVLAGSEPYLNWVSQETEAE